MLGKIASKEWGQKVKHICLPAEVSQKVRPLKLAARYVNGLLDPVRLNKTVLKGFRARLGNFGYSGQFDQHPVPLEGGMFKTGRIKVEGLAAELASQIRYWDKAATDEAGCYTAGVRMARAKDGVFWIINVKRGQWDPFEREEVLKQTAQMDTRACPIGVEQEPGSGGKESAINTIRRTLVGFVVRADRPVGKKVYRADPFAVQVNAGNVKIAAEPDGSAPPWAAAYLDELQYFPNSQFMDQTDASSGAFAALNNAPIRVGGAR
jgi:predicted phage terminase large subunit-like protein